MNGKAGRGADQFMLRLPDGMRDRIKAAAEANNRSMNAEIVARLSDTFETTSPAVVTALDNFIRTMAHLKPDMTAKEAQEIFGGTLNHMRKRPGSKDGPA